MCDGLTLAGWCSIPKPRSRLMANELITHDMGSSGTSAITSSRPLGLKLQPE